MLPRAQKLIVVSLLITVVGAHWAVLQGAAWMGMLFSYSRHAPFQQAWTKTFSDKYPCQLCRLVKEGKKSEHKQERLKRDLNFEFTFFASAALLYPPGPDWQFAEVSAYAAPRLEAPPAPPPRSV